MGRRVGLSGVGKGTAGELLRLLSGGSGCALAHLEARGGHFYGEVGT